MSQGKCEKMDDTDRQVPGLTLSESRIKAIRQELNGLSKWVYIGGAGGYVIGILSTTWGPFSHILAEKVVHLSSIMLLAGGLIGYFYSKYREKKLDAYIGKERHRSIQTDQSG